MFMREERARSQQELTQMKPKEVMAKLAIRWKGLTDPSREEYKDRANANRDAAAALQAASTAVDGPAGTLTRQPTPCRFAQSHNSLC